MIEEIKKEIEDKIKHLEKLMKPKKGVKPYGLEFEMYNNSLLRYKEFIDILDKYKDKEDKIRELITAPIDGMSLDRLGRDILQILNEGVIK